MSRIRGGEVGFLWMMTYIKRPVGCKVRPLPQQGLHNGVHPAQMKQIFSAADFARSVRLKIWPPDPL
jgi:hypothetical protein